MRWLKLTFVTIGLFWLLILPTPVLADTSQTVTITATGIVVDAPGGFTIYYISDYELGISWTKAVSANNTMVRAKYGSYPDGRTDGYLVYYGMEASCSDTGVNLEETASTIYYRAWSEDTDKIWSPVYAEGYWESIVVTLIANVLSQLSQQMFPLLALALFSFLAFWKLNALLFMLTAGISLMVGLQWYDVYTTSAGLTVGLMMIAYAFVCIAFAFRCLFWRGTISEE